MENIQLLIKEIREDTSIYTSIGGCGGCILLHNSTCFQIEASECERMNRGIKFMVVCQ